MLINSLKPLEAKVTTLQEASPIYSMVTFSLCQCRFCPRPDLGENLKREMEGRLQDVSTLSRMAKSESKI